jgi:hypothetical protein
MSGEFQININNKIEEGDKVLFLLSPSIEDQLQYIAINSFQDVTYSLAETSINKLSN